MEGTDGKERDQRISYGVLLFATYNLPSHYLNAASVMSSRLFMLLAFDCGIFRPTRK